MSGTNQTLPRTLVPREKVVDTVCLPYMRYKNQYFIYYSFK